MKTFQRTKYVFTSKDHCNVYQLFIVTSLQLLLPVIQTIFFRCRDFQPSKKKSAKFKYLLFSQKPQKFHTAEITGYTVFDPHQNLMSTKGIILQNLLPFDMKDQRRR
jgi:hypothetical protein